MERFSQMDVYKRRDDANKVSYLWDDIIQRTCQNALDGTLVGNANLLKGQSAIHEMAKEPRFSRRSLSEHMFKAIEDFPQTNQPLVRKMSFMPSYFQEVGYVFLQLKSEIEEDYESEYRPKRQAVLEVACGAARNKFPHLEKVVGIAIDAPKFATSNSEDFILLDCKEWTEETRNISQLIWIGASLKRASSKNELFQISLHHRKREGRPVEMSPVRAGQIKSTRNAVLTIRKYVLIFLR